ncbi:hypothetical protein jhhlp_004997 [Lomentospora prolificans]|uniref:Prostacyclin synthase n=1 Tax=Lomentospora prolificans TaxID=41688 RepID=A0A2N3N831_9PEZI|nr:hypothetical protein jhhlp_004997 [Lomentospora prolificans]
MLPWPTNLSVAGRLSEVDWTPGMVAAVAALPVALYLFQRVVFPTVDAREPPILRPKVPFFGHIISLIREYTSMFDRLYKEKALPICSLPMLNGYIYVINDPALISAAMRNRNLSFDPFSLEFAVGSLGMTQHHVDLFSAPGMMDEITHVIHSSLTGDNVFQMNVKALADISSLLNKVKPSEGLHVADVSHWLRDLMTMATMAAMFGKNNPFAVKDVPDFWEFDKGVGLLALGIAQNILAPNALAARKRSQAKLAKFYEARLDEGDDVAAIIKNRAALERRLGIPPDEMANIEYSMAFVGTSNTIPTLIWFFLNVFASDDFVARIRAEVQQVATIETNPDTGKRTATIDITRLEKGCPTLFACYRETLRKYSDVLGNRRVMADTTLRDPTTGHEYLLRKGINVQWPAQVTHNLPSVWGEDTDAFRPERFIDTSSLDEKKRRGAMVPFGGGRNLCPGRYFAQAENLGFVSAVALGFDVEGVKVPPSGNAWLGTAVRRPDWSDISPSITIKRRPGWEDVSWGFKC